VGCGVKKSSGPFQCPSTVSVYFRKQKEHLEREIALGLSTDGSSTVYRQRSVSFLLGKLVRALVS
jgi:hypothetical protein